MFSLHIDTVWDANRRLTVKCLTSYNAIVEVDIVLALRALELFVFSQFHELFVMRWDLEEAIFNIVATYILTVSSEFHHFSRLTELEQNHVFPCASSTELKGLGADFVFGFVQSMDGERDPRNLLLAFQVAKTIIRRGYDLGESTHACGTFRVPTHSGRPGNLKAGFPGHGN